MSNLWKFKNFLPNQTGNRHILSVFVFSFLFNRKVFVKYLLSFCKVFAGTCTGGRTSSKPNRADTSRRLKFVCQQSLKPDDNSTQRLIQSRFKFQVAGDKAETMAGKRKAPVESSSDEDEEAIGVAGMVAGSDSNWEDQDTSDEGEAKKLRIAIPKKKKVRKKKSPRSPRRGSEPVNIPEDFLSECSKLFLDKRLDDKAARINWGRKQVKDYFETSSSKQG